MVEAGQPLQHGPLKYHAEDADYDGSDQQRPPISDAGQMQEEIGAERAHHVERAMGEIDDVEHAEDHGEPETKQRVERSVDQSHQKLGVKSLHRFRTQSRLGRGIALGRERWPAGTAPAGGRCYFFTSGQALSESGRKAWSPGVVPIRL